MDTDAKDSGDIVKDEEAELLADFNELIDAEKFDIDEDLEDLNSIIMNPEILEEKISDCEPIKDADDSSQATSTDDYDKLKIKQIVETIQDLAGVAADNPQPQVIIVHPMIDENEIIPEPEASSNEPASIEMIEANPVESNDSTKPEEVPVDEKVVMISDESSNQTTDEPRKEEIEKVDGEESSTADDIKDDPNGEDVQTFQGGIPIADSDENSLSSEKVSDVKEPAVDTDATTTDFHHIEDSEDAIFEDAKEQQQHEPSTEKSIPEVTDTKQEIEEASRSAIDSDEEVLEVKISRRRKGNDSLKADTPSSSTRSRDHSENDDNRDSTPIRTRSRHSSTAVSISESKSSFTFSKEQDHSMWKARWDDCVKELQKLKEFSQIIDNKIIQDEVYKKVCLQPMNMKIIAKNIDSNVSTLTSDIKRDFVLMCTNIIMLNNKGRRFNNMVHQFTKDCIEIIESQMDVEDAYKSYRRQIKKKLT